MKENRHTPQWWRSRASKSTNPVGFGFYKCWLPTMHHCNQHWTNESINPFLLLWKCASDLKFQNGACSSPRPVNGKLCILQIVFFWFFKVYFSFLKMCISKLYQNVAVAAPDRHPVNGAIHYANTPSHTTPNTHRMISPLSTFSLYDNICSKHTITTLHYANTRQVT